VAGIINPINSSVRDPLCARLFSVIFGEALLRSLRSLKGYLPENRKLSNAVGRLYIAITICPNIFFGAGPANDKYFSNFLL